MLAISFIGHSGFPSLPRHRGSIRRFSSAPQRCGPRGHQAGHPICLPLQLWCNWRHGARATMSRFFWPGLTSSSATVRSGPQCPRRKRSPTNGAPCRCSSSLSRAVARKVQQVSTQSTQSKSVRELGPYQ